MNWNNFFFFLGLACVVVMLFTFDVSFVELWGHITRAGYWLIPIVGVWIIIYGINALAWYAVIRGTIAGADEAGAAPDGMSLREKTSTSSFLWRIYKLTITGYALNYATPVGGLGGEPYRIMELSHDIPRQQATSSVILYAMMHVFAHFWFWFTSVFLYLVLALAGDLPLDATIGIMLAVIVAFCLMAFYLFYRGYKYGLVVRLIRWAGHIPGLGGWSHRFLEAHAESLHNIDTQIAALHSQSRRHFYTALSLEYLSRIVQSTEVLFMLLLFGVDGGGGFGGITLTFLHSILIVSLTTLLANLIGFLPMQLGVQEGGFAVSTALMGLTTAMGMFVSIICRVREIIWIFIGIMLMRVGGKREAKQVAAAAVMLILCCLPAGKAQAQEFGEWFEDSTLRLDYVFAGDAGRQELYVDQLSQMPRWYGRRTRLAELPLAGNGQITVRAHGTGQVIYRHSFSTLFQEWLATDEAKRVQRSFENVFLVPFPRDTVDVTVELLDFHHSVLASMTHTVVPTDILISRKGERGVSPYITLQQAADTSRCIHIAYVPEGYTREQMPAYIGHCRTAMEALFRHEPFRSLRHRFNIVALLTPSADSGVSDPEKGLWLNTALGSHFDTFYSQRYLTTLHLKRLHDLLAGTPYEHIIILANTEHYGGGGIYNSYNLSYTGGDRFEPVVVHEFGHSFGGLGDEYPYGEADPMYFADTEPWEPNLTTLHDFSGKWQNLIDEGRASLVEGGGYLTKGVYRGQDDCRMRTNEEPDFCPVCQQALRRLIDFYTAKE